MRALVIVILLSFVILSNAEAQVQPNTIALYSDPGFTSTELADVSGLVYVYILHTGNTDYAKASQFKVQKSPGFAMTWLQDAMESPFIWFGDTQTGIGISYGYCHSSADIYLGRIIYMADGTSTSCSSLEVVPHPTAPSGQIEIVDCSNIIRYGSGGVLNVNRYCCETVHHVPGEHATIQDAIDYATDCDTVMLAPGTYTGPGNTEINFNNKAIVLTSSTGPIVTTIDCQGTGTAVYMASGSEISDITITGANDGAVFSNGADAKILRSNIIDNQTDGMSGMGGGIHVSGGTLTIENCVIEDNVAMTRGGGVQINNATVTIRNSTLTFNDAPSEGGAIYASRANLRIEDTTIDRNAAFDYGTGGGISLGMGPNTLVLRDCQLTRNQCAVEGGGIAGRVDSLLGCTLENNTVTAFDIADENTGGGAIDGPVTYAYGNTFRNNKVTRDDLARGGAINGNCGVVIGNLFVGNQANSSGLPAKGTTIFGDIQEFRENTLIVGDPTGESVIGTPILMDCAIIYNETSAPIFDPAATLTPVISCSDLYSPLAPVPPSAYTDAGNNVAADPLFCYPETGDYHVASSSPCLGSPCGQMGAFGQGCTSTGTQDTPIPGDVALYQNAPNPFNPTTTIRYYLPDATLVTLRVYDASGRVVKDLVNESVPAGPHEVRWHGLNDRGQRVSSGVYFYQLRAGNVSETKKMVLLK